MKILVAAAAYPILDEKKLYYVHSRNLYYKNNGMDVEVLNFAVSDEYFIDGIRVIGLPQFRTGNMKYDILICHAANIRNHYRFIKKYGKEFRKVLFVFHGHEILHINKWYPKPYSYMKKNKIPAVIQDMYDDLKIFLWKKYFDQNIDNIRMIFVSKWMYKRFLDETKIEEKNIKNHSEIISNSVGKFFEDNSYMPGVMEYDFITIRGNLDGRKYCIDIVANLAKQNPQYTFLLIGKGNFFDYYEKSENIIWINQELSHEEMIQYLNKTKFALLPTRADAQGLMACELATYGIPLITSDIDVCQDIFDTCPNVALLDNNAPDLERAVEELKDYKGAEKWDKFLAEKTIVREMKYIEDYVIEKY